MSFTFVFYIDIQENTKTKYTLIFVFRYSFIYWFIFNFGIPVIPYKTSWQTRRRYFALSALLPSSLSTLSDRVENVSQKQKKVASDTVSCSNSKVNAHCVYFTCFKSRRQRAQTWSNITIKWRRDNQREHDKKSICYEIWRYVFSLFFA